MKLAARRDGRVAEGARLESVYTFTGIGGSNPSLSASIYARACRSHIELRRSGANRSPSATREEGTASLPDLSTAFWFSAWRFLSPAWILNKLMDVFLTKFP